jgi:hypothetical protein
MAIQLIGPVSHFHAATMPDKVNIPRDIVSDIMCIERNQTMTSYQSQIHMKALKHLEEFFPSDAPPGSSQRAITQVKD